MLAALCWLFSYWQQMFFAFVTNLLAASALPHLLPSHQEEVNSSHVDINAVTEISEDLSDGGVGPQGDRRTGAVGQHHTAVFGGTFAHPLPHRHGVSIVRLEIMNK